MGAYDYQEQVELVDYETLHFLKVFINRLFYRTPHMHPELEITLICTGQCVVAGKGLDTELTQGDIIVFNPSQMHEISSVNGSAKVLTVQISQEWLRFFRIDRLWFENNVLVNQSGSQKRIELSTKLCSLAAEYFSQKRHCAFYCLELISSIIYDLLCVLPNHFRSEDSYLMNQKGSRISEVLSYIEAHFTEKITLEQLGQQFFMSPQYLSHFFKKNVGITFSDFVQNLRFGKAINLIDNTELPLTTICVECGFSDYKYMERMFKSKLGCSPKQYRLGNKPAGKRCYSRSNEYIYTASEAAEFINKIAHSIVP